MLLECPCDLPTCPTSIARLRLRRLQPRQAIIEAGQEAPTSPFVLVTANAMFDVRYKRSGAAAMFISHILEEKSTVHDDHVYWLYPVVGLTHILSSIITANSHTRDYLIYREMFEAYPKIIDVIAKDFDYAMRFNTPMERLAVSRVCTMIFYYAEYHAMKQLLDHMMYSENTLKIVLYSWLNCPLPRAGYSNRRRIIQAVDHLFYFRLKGTTALCLCEPPPDYLITAFRPFDIDTVVSQVISKLKNKKLFGESLLADINIIRYLMHMIAPVFWPLLENNLLKHLINAMRRQLKYPDDEHTVTIIRTGGALLGTILHFRTSGNSRINLLIDLYKNSCFTAVATDIFKISCKNGSLAAEPWYSIFEMIKFVFDCDPADEYGNALRASLESLPVRTMLVLKDDVDPSRKYYKVLGDLWLRLGITSASVWERYRLNKKCCHMECPKREAGIRSEKKYKCKGCHSVWYCDSACQKIDWKHHRSECKEFALKYGPHS